MLPLCCNSSKHFHIDVGMHKRNIWGSENSFAHRSGGYGLVVYFISVLAKHMPKGRTCVSLYVCCQADIIKCLAYDGWIIFACICLARLKQRGPFYSWSVSPPTESNQCITISWDRFIWKSNWMYQKNPSDGCTWKLFIASSASDRLLPTGLGASPCVKKSQKRERAKPMLVGC